MKHAPYFFLPLLVVALPAFVSAQQVSAPLVELNLPEGSGFNGYINGLYILSISLAALLAVIKIIIAGAKYAFTDVVSAKGSAKQDITSALFGLLLIMGAVLILELINPRLTSTTVQFQEIEIPPRVQSNPSIQSTGSTPPTAPPPTGTLPPPPGGSPPPGAVTSRCGTDQETRVTTVGRITNTNIAVCPGTTRADIQEMCEQMPGYQSVMNGPNDVTCVVRN
ncbi:MAG TPA: hypothetical protein VGE31_02715 [Candidatus Paceibacterota bacterium]